MVLCTRSDHHLPTSRLIFSSSNPLRYSLPYTIPPHFNALPAVSFIQIVSIVWPHSTPCGFQSLSTTAHLVLLNSSSHLELTFIFGISRFPSDHVHLFTPPRELLPARWRECFQCTSHRPPTNCLGRLRCLGTFSGNQLHQEVHYEGVRYWRMRLHYFLCHEFPFP
jgi:hypothetical protein